MTNYDRWKLATPDYLEDEDARVHSTSIDEQDESDLQQHLQSDQEDAKQELDPRGQKDSPSGGGNKRQEIWTHDGPD